MADQEKSNIKQEYTGAVVGINMDNAPSQIRKGSLSYALNAVVENFDDTSVNYQNELGNELCLTFPEGYTLIGNHHIPEQDKHIFFLVNNSSSDSEIGYMENNDCVYHTLVNAPCLNFNIHYPIHKVVHKITSCTTEIYWTDGYNPRRYLDIDNIPYLMGFGGDLCNPSYSNMLDCNQLSVQPNFNVPLLTVNEINSGGDLRAGAYQFAIQYSDAVGNPLSSYYSVTNPIPIADPQISTVNYNYPVGKSINIGIHNLDVTGLYEYYNIAVIKTINGISSVELVGTYFIEAADRQLTYTGQDVANIRLSIDDIFERYPYYEIADDVTVAQDVLIWSNLSSIDRINYQEIANKIELRWESWRIPSSENYADEYNATNLRGYLRDEVYSFEIAFILSNGKETDSFHIPGRKKNFNDVIHPDISDSNPDFVGTPFRYEGGVGYSPYWKIYNTATVIGYSTGYSSADDYKGPYQYGEFAYWESTEEYPCNKNVWGDLAGEKIRHHKFPDVAISPIFESKEFTDVDSLEMGNCAVFPIGVRVDPQSVRAAINSSSLSLEEKNQIVGFKILRGNRNTNKSIVAKGILRNVNSYNRDGRDFYYPNYPYNDLREDPFLNVSNNAYLSECESFTVNITNLLYSPSRGKDCAEVSYTDCSSNKTKVEVYTEIGEYLLCSITKPTFTSGEGTISYINYDEYELKRIGVGGWIGTYEDITEGTKTVFVFGPASKAITVKVVVGTEPAYVEGDNPDKAVITFLGRHILSTECSYSTPLPAFTDKERQVFNSPETSFAQPFLGNILKLESVIFGKGNAHFKEVEKNAKYKLISKEAQQQALDSSSHLASMTDEFDSAAMFAAYQSYLQIFINGISYRNYAYSFNSIASYDYSVGVPDDEGIKQRNIENGRYIIPAVISVGDDNVNNYQRESSVYIKTGDELPFPDKSSNMLSGTNSTMSDLSRFTVSEKGNCNEPEKIEDIRVVSYYASLKKDVVNQWGQIYSYDTIDTGFTYIFGYSQDTVVFGGDTFISRFAFKTKLPFFIDNRVNAPDGSDIYYDEIGNVAYPKYWHSSRSIFDDYSIPPGDSISSPGVLKNFISYKAHNLDCPNDTSIIYSTITTSTTMNPSYGTVTTGDTDSTYYDGYFYLFAYGIPNFYCESSYNLDLRQAFNNREGDFWPHVTSSIPDNWVQESFVSIANDNTYYYNTSLVKQNKESFYSHLPADWDDRICLKSYPFRSIYSDARIVDADNRVNNWRIYRATSYYDFPQNFGDLVSLDGIQNRGVVARFENKTLLYNKLLTLDTSNPQAAYLGNPALFKGSPPIDLADTDLGYVGSQHKLFLKIPQGQIMIDAKRGQVFLLSTSGEVKDLSAFGSGMNKFFTEHLSFNILKSFPNAKIDNHFNGLGLHAVYDSRLDRIIITKLDYLADDSGVMYDEETDEYYTLDFVGNRVLVFLGDPYFFTNKSWTVSFNMNTGSWISFHGYLPNWYIAENNFFYSGINSCCDEFDFIAAEVENDFFTTSTTTEEPTTTTTTTCEDCTTTTTTTCGDCTTTTSTSTTSTSTSSTTTTTTTLYPCELDGYYEPYEVTTSTTSTSTTICVRPRGLEIIYLIKGYYLDEIEFDSTADPYTACEVMNWLYDLVDIDPSFLIVEGFGIHEGSVLYLQDGTTDCECNIPDGWYFANETVEEGYVFHIENCVITEIFSCPVYTTTTTSSSSTTTTTTLYPPSTTTTTTIEPTTTTTTTCDDCTTTTTTTCEDCTTTTTSSTSTTSSTTTTTTTIYSCGLDGYYEFVVTTTSTSSTTTTTTTVEPTTTTTTSSTTTSTSSTTTSTSSTTTSTSSSTTTTTTTGECYLSANLYDITCDDLTTTTTTCYLYVTVPDCEEVTTTTTSSSTSSTTTTSSTTEEPTTTTTTTNELVECLENLKIEFIYINDASNDETILNTYAPEYDYPGFLDDHGCDYALFEVYANNIFIGEGRITNGGSGECKNDSRRPDEAQYCMCHDYKNRPDELVQSSGKTWLELGGHYLARYDKIVLSTEKALQIGAISENNTWITFSIRNVNGWYDVPCGSDLQPGYHALSNVYCWVRISNSQGQVLYNGYPSGPFLTVNVCEGAYIPTTTSTTTDPDATTTTSTTVPICNLNYTIDDVSF